MCDVAERLLEKEHRRGRTDRVSLHGEERNRNLGEQARVKRR